MAKKSRDLENTTIGFWVGEDDSDLLKEIDEHVDWQFSSRSEWVRGAAQMRLAIEEAGFDPNDYPNDFEMRSALRQAVHEWNESQSEPDVPRD